MSFRLFIQTTEPSTQRYEAKRRKKRCYSANDARDRMQACPHNMIHDDISSRVHLHASIQAGLLRVLQNKYPAEILLSNHRARWPSGLRRQLKEMSASPTLVRKGVGSNPTLVNIFFAFVSAMTDRQTDTLGSCLSVG